MPVYVLERTNVRAIAGEFEKIAKALRAWPESGGDTARGSSPSKTILTSLQKINTTLAEGAKRGALTPSSFAAMGRAFGTIGSTLQGLGPAAKSSKRPKSR